MATTEDRPASLDGIAEWRRQLYEASPERQGELFSTISGLEVDPLYTADSVEIDEERDLGYPGIYPFTRGVYPSMYRGKLWTMRQFAGFGTAAETNERFRYLRDHGQTGLSTAFDMPTLMGYDSDHPRSLGEVGREGVAIDSLADMETLFEGIPLGEVSTSMTINSPAARRIRTFFSRPDAMIVCAPLRAARFAASTFVSMPPRLNAVPAPPAIASSAGSPARASRTSGASGCFRGSRS